MAESHPQFQGHIGINETPLTVAITEGNHTLAEEIIEATTDVSYLNDGSLQDVPLHMVLRNDLTGSLKRNLRLAKMLVQKGANPNLRIPFADFERTSPSPFEELVVCYEIIRYFSTGIFHLLSEKLEMYVAGVDVLKDFVNNTLDVDGNLCLPTMGDCERLVLQMSELIDIFLENGGDPNVITTFHRKTLFHWVVEHDIILGERFLKTCRVNINLCDVHGTSPLMDVISCNETEEVLSFYKSMGEMVDTLDVNCRNCIGETALFRSCFVGDVEMASKLYDDGAIIDSSVCCTLVPFIYSTECKLCANAIPHHLYHLPSPLLAPLLTDAPVRLSYDHVESSEPYFTDVAPHKHLIDKLIMSSISPLIDMFHFKSLSGAIEATSITSILEQLTSLLEHTNFNHLRDGRILTQDLVCLMFGQLSSGLRQLCIRTIFDHVLMISEIPKKSWPDFVFNDFCIKDCKRAMMEPYISQLIELIQLPQSFKIFFEIEAAKYQLCKLIMSFQCLECQQGCSESEISGSIESFGMDSDSDASVYDTSLYSSDMLSDESFDEMDDLSDELSCEDELDEEEEEEEEEVSESSSGSSDKIRSRRKKKSEYERLSSGSDDIKVVVETFCENVAENVAQQEHEFECHENLETLNKDGSNSPSSYHCTSPSSSSESDLKLSTKDFSSDTP